jgi:hypothetical protein
MQKFLRLALIVTVCFSCAFWQTRQACSANAEITLPVEIPMQVGDGIPTVEVMVNGQGPFVFGFDTGAQANPRIDASLVERLKLKATGEVEATDPSRRNPQASQTFKVESLSLGSLRFADVTVVSRNYRNSPLPFKVDDVLGLDLFAEYLVTLDFPGKKLRIEKGELPKSDGVETLDYKNSAGIAEVPTAFAESLAMVGEPRVVGRARSAGGEIEIKQVQLKDTVKLGRHEFPGTTAVYPALGEIANVGVKVLSQFVITFDQQHGRVRLRKA